MSSTGKIVLSVIVLVGMVAAGAYLAMIQGLFSRQFSTAMSCSPKLVAEGFVSAVEVKPSPEVGCQ